MSESEKLKDAVCRAIRWHYYDRRRGEHSADPAQNGMEPEMAAHLEASLEANLVQTLKRQGEWWADQELERQAWDGLEWDSICGDFEDGE